MPDRIPQGLNELIEDKKILDKDVKKVNEELTKKIKIRKRGKNNESK